MCTCVLLCAQVTKEVRKPPEVSYADLQALTARVDHAAAELGSVGQSMQQLRAKDLVVVHEQIADLVDQVNAQGGKGGRGLSTETQVNPGHTIDTWACMSMILGEACP